MGHFSKEETACKDGCGFNSPNPKLMDLLERIREHFGVPVLLNCVCRCKKHNQEVGGERDSQHLLGNAADIKVAGIDPSTVWHYLDPIVTGGLGRYNTFNHVDVRDKHARWDNRTGVK